MVHDGEVWVGIDLGSQKHQVCALGSERKPLLERAFEHSEQAVLEVIAMLVALVGEQIHRLRVSVETPSAMVVDLLLESGLAVFSINPKQVDRFRDRYSPAGAKDDRRDAYVLASALKTDEHAFRRVEPLDAEGARLRAYTRLHQQLTTDLNGLANRVDAELIRCFPEIRRLGSVHTEVWMMRLLSEVPTRHVARKLRKAQLDKLLHGSRLGQKKRAEIAALIEALKAAKPREESPAEAFAAEALGYWLPRLLGVREQLARCDQMIEDLLNAQADLGLQVAPETMRLTEASASLPEAEGAAASSSGALDVAALSRKRNRAAAILRSLPGAGSIVCSTIWSEANHPLIDADYSRLRAICGVAPVCRKSGKSGLVLMRKACNPRLRQAMYHWARCSIQYDARCEWMYRRMRERGLKHGRALRGLADRLLGLLVTLMRSGELFDRTKWAPPEAAA